MDESHWRALREIPEGLEIARYIRGQDERIVKLSRKSVGQKFRIQDLVSALMLWKLRAGTDPALADLALDTAALLQGAEFPSCAEEARQILDRAVERQERANVHKLRWS